jgi:hypothetical protein
VKQSNYDSYENPLLRYLCYYLFFRFRLMDIQLPWTIVYGLAVFLRGNEDKEFIEGSVDTEDIIWILYFYPC